MRRFLRKLGFRLRQARNSAELEEELRLHRELRTEQLREQGTEDAARAANLRFGNQTVVLEAACETWRWRLGDEFVQNVRYAVRMWRKDPGFTLVTALTLALAIGANAAVFSIFHAVLLTPLPYGDAKRLVVVWDLPVKAKNPAPVFASFADFEQLHRYSRSFSDVAAATWAWSGRVWQDHGVSKALLVIPATANFFRMLGVNTALGRTFTPEDEQRGCAVVLAHDFWQGKLASRADVVGSTLTLDNEPCTVLGVMPESFSFYPRQAQMWMLLGPHPKEAPIVGIFARLRPGVTLAQARAEVSSLHRALHDADKTEAGLAPAVFRLQDQFRFLAGRTLQTTVWLLTAAVFLVLLIACLNVANLLLGRSLVRERELAVRAALGAGRAGLIRQLLTESISLSALGCLAGLVFALAAIRCFNHLNPIELPVGADVTLNLPVVAFSLLLTVGATLLFGLFPAFRASRIDLNVSLKAGRGPAKGISRPHVARAIVTVEVMLSVVLLMGAGLVLKSLLRMSSEPLGFDSHDVVFTATALRGGRYTNDAERARLCRQVSERLRGLSGIPTAISSNLPLYVSAGDSIEVAGRTPTDPKHDTGFEAVGPGYFALMKTPLLSGRDFNDHDTSASEPVAIINRALADEYFPNEDALGQRIRLTDLKTQQPWLTIAGIVENQKHSELMHEMSWLATPAVFRPVLQDPPARNIYVLAKWNVSAMRDKLLPILSGIDPELPVSEPEALESDLALALKFPRFRAVLLGVFALAAVLLAAIGLHGVVAQFLAQRKAEFGIRMAIGAQPRDLFLLIACQGGVPVLAGAALGVAVALLLDRALRSVLYGDMVSDPLVVISVVSLLVLTGAAAIWRPARLAARTDPVVTLRNE